ncbi:MAG: beta-N-acetylhexosaminidase [Planctomycetes bacterium]|nr:beta-N-acetylhexosaminidase [Planctomycetota bacterium]
MNIIPLPKRVESLPGKWFLIPESSIVCSGCDNLAATAEVLAERLRCATGYDIPVIEGKEAASHDILLKVDQGDDAGAGNLDFPDESYTLKVGSEGAHLSSQNRHGLCRAVQTFLQLFPESVYSDSVMQGADWSIAGVIVDDAPVFKWRGLHLDVSRYFADAEMVKRYIDLAAMHKHNVFHWHLTDDQGWRLPVDGYPLATEIGGFRDETLIGHERERPRKFDGKRHGGYYTKEEIKEIVAFADARGVTVVPEIDLPGHCQSLIAAYPEFGAAGYRPEVCCHWGVNQHVLNLEPVTLDFLAAVVDTVCDLFPSRIIHIGGDEVPTHYWSLSKQVQKRMVELGINSDRGVQGWFTTRLAELFAAHGRSIIGWDEIVEGGAIPDDAMVMRWRANSQDALAALKSGRKVIDATTDWTYFDSPQSDSPDEPLAINDRIIDLKKIYSNEPGADFPPELRSGVLGGQGQVWCEYMPTGELVDYMLYPRACALSDVLWSDKENRDYVGFMKRLNSHYKRLDLLGVKARKYD